MSHKRAKQDRQLVKADPLNDPSQWSAELRPPYFDRETFQFRLDLRAGKNMDNKSVLVLRWAPEVFTELYDEKTPRYWVTRVRDGEQWLYTSVPRWIIERRLEKGQYADSWNKTRWIPDGEGGFIDKGPPPDDYHIFTWLCAEHEALLKNGQPACCQRAWEGYQTVEEVDGVLQEVIVGGRQRCWGTYRSPNDYDLQCVEAAVRRREGEQFIDPYAPLSPHDLEIIEATSGLQMERVAMEQEQRQMEILRDLRAPSEVNNRIIYTPN